MAFYTRDGEKVLELGDEAVDPGADDSFDPGREIRESVFDYFADSMVEGEVNLDSGLYQRFRQSLVRLSKDNPLLKRLIAQANNVSDRIDLDAAARAEKVIRESGKLLGGIPRPGDSPRDMFARGYNFVVGSSDVLLLRDAAIKNILENSPED